MGICNVTWEHLGTATALHKCSEIGAAPQSRVPQDCCLPSGVGTGSPVGTALCPAQPRAQHSPVGPEAAVGAVRPLDTGISPPCANAALSTAGLALSLELHASTAGAWALGRGGDGAGPELMQCQCQPGPADAAPLSSRTMASGARPGEMALAGRPSRPVLHRPALCPCRKLGDVSYFPFSILSLRTKYKELWQQRSS